MKICEWCGKEFELKDAADYFEAETWLLSYENVEKCLCGECAVEAINELVDGVYFETCERCGKKFDLIENESEFDSFFPSCNGIGLRDTWDQYGLILCAECAVDMEDSEGDDYDMTIV